MKKNTPSVRIVLAESHELMRQTIRLLLERNPHWKVVGEAKSGLQVIGCVRDLNPDILVIDVSMPDTNTQDIVKKVISCSHNTRVIALSLHSNAGYRRQLLESGATAFLLKDRVFEELPAVIKAAVSKLKVAKRAISTGPV